MNYKPRDITQDELDHLDAHGFVWQGGWDFMCDGEVYDLSASDLSQIEIIRHRGLFKRNPAQAAEKEGNDG